MTNRTSPKLVYSFVEFSNGQKFYSLGLRRISLERANTDHFRKAMRAYGFDNRSVWANRYGSTILSDLDISELRKLGSLYFD